MIKSMMIVGAMLLTGAAGGMVAGATGAKTALPAAGCVCGQCEAGCDCCGGEACICEQCSCTVCDC